MGPRIVCGVDQSSAAGLVAATARWVAAALDAPLVFVHVAPRADSRTREDELTATIGEQLGLDPGEIRLAEGAPAAALMSIADEEQAGMLVVGARGMGALRTTILGSVSRDLAEHAHCPVLVVPPGSSRPAGDAQASIVCGLDGSDHALAAAKLAAGLAARMRRRLILVHAQQNLEAAIAYLGARATTPAATSQEDARRLAVADILERATEAVGAEAIAVTEPGPPARVIEAVAERERADLTVIAARGMHPARAAALGSVTRKLTTTAARPVVVLPEAAEASSPPWTTGSPAG